MYFIFHNTKYIFSLLNKKSPLIYLLATISVLFILFLSIIIITEIYFRNSEYYKDDYFLTDNKTIYFEEKFDSYEDAFNKARIFIKNNLQGKLINTEKIKTNEKPKISVVIPCYNCHEFILKTLRSVQNQNFSDFEIIIANDGSTPETLAFIEKMQKEDNRIKIINNKKNMGTLYTRCVGTLSAKGKYIIPIDGDDMILNNNVFDVLINIEMKSNFDIIIFNSIFSSLKTFFFFFMPYSLDLYDGNHIPNRVLFQPDLGYYSISPGDKIDEIKANEVLIHGKLIKKKIYKKAINKLGIERYTRFMIAGEDDLIVNSIFNVAKNAKFIPYYGYIHVNNAKSVSKEQNKIFPEIRKHLYILDPLIDLTLNSQRNKKVLVNYILYFMKFQNLKDFLNNNEYDNNIFISCLDRIFDCKYISDEHKNEIRKRGKMLDFIKYNF